MADALGFPDATDTGVQAGVTLKAYNGDLIINTPGAVISGLDIHGSVIINADNVTLINCRITSSDYFIVSVGGGGRGTGGSAALLRTAKSLEEETLRAQPEYRVPGHSWRTTFMALRTE